MTEYYFFNYSFNVGLFSLAAKDKLALPISTLHAFHYSMHICKIHAGKSPVLSVTLMKCWTPFSFSFKKKQECFSGLHFRIIADQLKNSFYGCWLLIKNKIQVCLLAENFQNHKHGVPLMDVHDCQEFELK